MKLISNLTLFFALSPLPLIADSDPGVDVNDKNNHAIEHIIEKEAYPDDVEERILVRQKHFNKLDLNGNGILTRKEFLEARERYFDKLDTNGDKVLNEKHTVQVVNINKMDTNKDKVVTKEEYLDKNAKHFDGLDKNADQELDFDEFVRPFLRK